METLPHEKCELKIRPVRDRGLEAFSPHLVSVLARSRNTDGPRPVVVEVGQLVRQLLEVLRLQSAGVLQHVVTRGVDGPLPYRLTHQEEVVPSS